MRQPELSDISHIYHICKLSEIDRYIDHITADVMVIESMGLTSLPGCLETCKWTHTCTTQDAILASLCSTVE